MARELRDAWPNPSPNGDDCALIPDGSGYKLLAIEDLSTALWQKTRGLPAGAG
ncbi:hypothetical protein OVX87_29360 [Klebsiella pneumoniae]|nr:hypothetical protein [Klebsiella pneumoniae]